MSPRSFTSIFFMQPLTVTLSRTAAAEACASRCAAEVRLPRSG